MLEARELNSEIYIPDAVKSIIVKPIHRATLKKMTQYFVSKGLDRSIPNQVCGGGRDIESLDIEELINLLGVYYKYSNIDEINPYNLFSKETVDKIINSELEKFEPIPNPTDRQKKIIVFIDETYGNSRTRKSLFQLYTQFVQDIEEELKMDLERFAENDIKYLVNSVIGSAATKRSLFVFLNRYFEYCVENNTITDNPMAYISREKIIQKNKVELAHKYVSFDDLYDNLMELIESNGSKIVLMDAIYALLMRSGFTAKQIVDMKFSDFDSKHNMLNVKKENGVKKIKIDNRIIELIKKHKDSVDRSGGRSGTRYELNIIDDHIVKTTKDYYDKETAFFSIKRRMAKFTDSGYMPLTEYQLNMCKKIDMLNTIKRVKGYVDQNDYESIQQSFGLSPDSYYRIKEEYEAIAG